MSDIFAILDQLGITVTKHEHPPVFTCEDAAKHWGHLTSTKAKNVFIRNRDKSAYYLLILEVNKRVDLKKLAKILNESRFSLGSPEDLKKYLDLTPGSVSPFGLVNKGDHNITVIIDRDFWSHDVFAFHPNINTATLEIGRDDFEKFLKYVEVPVEFYDL